MGRGGGGARRLVVLAGAAAGLAAAGAGGALRAARRGAQRLELRPRLIALADWPPELDGLTIGVLSDLHAGGPEVREPLLDRIAAETVAARPELIVVLGDVIDINVVGGEPLAPETIAARLAPLRAPLGVFAVLGNHDFTAGGERVRRALEEAGVRVLENEAVELRRGAAPLWLAAVGDEASGRADVHAALAAVPEGAPVLVATHSPDVFPRVPARVALTLAGHTHAGQVNLPLVRRRVIPSRFGDRFAGGLVEEQGRRLFVHPGIGTSRLPVRLRTTPEVTLLTLVGEPAAPAARAAG